MFSNLLASISDAIYALLDDLVFIDASIAHNLTEIIGNNSYSGINLICNSLIYGFLLYYSISYMLSHLTFSQVERPFQFIFKLLFCVIALNCSQIICSSIINLFSNISLFIKELGYDLLGYKISFSTFVNKINSNSIIPNESFNLFSFDGVLKGMTSIGFINLTISYAIRYVMIKVLIIISPFAILSLCNNKTSSFFKSWIKVFISMLFLQILVAVILVICFTIIYKDNILFLQIIHIGMVYSLVKANTFVRELMGGFSTDVSFNFSNISSIFNKKE